MTQSSTEVQTQTIRQWAVQNGYTVAATGRLPIAVVKAYKAAYNL